MAGILSIVIWIVVIVGIVKSFSGSDAKRHSQPRIPHRRPCSRSGTVHRRL